MTIYVWVSTIMIWMPIWHCMSKYHMIPYISTILLPDDIYYNADSTCIYIKQNIIPDLSCAGFWRYSHICISDYSAFPLHCFPHIVLAIGWQIFFLFSLVRQLLDFQILNEPNSDQSAIVLFFAQVTKLYIVPHTLAGATINGMSSQELTSYDG